MPRRAPIFRKQIRTAIYEEADSAVYHEGRNPRSVSGSQWSHPRIDSIAQLEGLLNLKSQNVNHIGLKSLAPVKMMTALQYLFCSNNHIRSLKPLEMLSELRELDVSYKGCIGVEEADKLNPN